MSSAGPNTSPAVSASTELVVESAAIVFPYASQRLIDLAHNGAPSIPNVEAYQNHLAQRLAELKREKRALKRCQNTLKPSCTLPIDVLSAIFLCVAERPPDEAWGHWQSVTHVCSYWRTVALGCAALWINMHSSQPQKVVDMMLARSKDAPLSINYVGGSGFIPFFGRRRVTDTLQIARLSPFRVRRLNVTVWSEEDMLLLEAIFAATPPGILPAEEISIFKWGSTEFNINFSKDLLRGGLPFLRRLTMQGVKASWTDLPLNANFTCLSLSREANRDSSGLFTMSDAVAILQQMPLIEDLRLCNYLPNNGHTEPSQTLDMPHLRSLALEDSLGTLCGILASIQLPKVETVDIVFRGCEANNIVDVDRALCFLRASTSSIKGGQHWCANLSTPAHLKLRNGLFDSGLYVQVHFGDTPPSSTAGLKLTFHSEHGSIASRTSPYYFDAIQRHLDLSSLLSFNDHRDFAHCRSWGHIGRLPHLHTVWAASLREDSVKSLCDALTQVEPSVPQISQNPKPLFPSLSTVKVSNIDISMADEGNLDACGPRLVDTFLKRPDIKNLSLHDLSPVEDEDEHDNWHNVWVLREKLPGVNIIWDEKE